MNCSTELHLLLSTTTMEKVEMESSQPLLAKFGERENAIIEEILQKLYSDHKKISKVEEVMKKIHEEEEMEEVKISVKYPIELKYDKEMGRCLAAARDIEAGEILLNDWPIVTAPNAGQGNTCLGCCSIREKLESCERCGWPVCTKQCSNIPQHLDFECKIFSKEHITPTLPSPYNFIASAEYIKILRCLLLRDESSPEKMSKWKQVLSLEAHMDIRKNIPRVQLMSRLVKRFIRSLCNMKQYDESTIDFVLGVVDVNAFRHSFAPEPLKPIRVPEAGEPQRNATFLYPQASMAAHGCVRNTDWKTLDGGQLEMWASHKILQGQIIYHAYVDLMLGTPERRRLLHNLFYFDCSCVRCKDPTELNTFFSALKCTNCKTGYLLMENPLEYKSCWVCNNPECNQVKPHNYERDLVAKILSEEKQVCDEIPHKTNLQTVKGLMKILKAHRNITLHPNHYRLVSIEYILVKHLLKITSPAKEIMLEIKRLVKKYMWLSSVFHPSVDDN